MMKRTKRTAPKFNAQDLTENTQVQTILGTMFRLLGEGNESGYFEQAAYDSACEDLEYYCNQEGLNEQELTSAVEEAAYQAYYASL